MISVFLAAALAQTQPLVPSPNPNLHEVSCRVGKKKLPAICGTYRVYEDRTAATGRTIALKFILIEAVHRANRAVAFNPGGPGASATEDAGFVADGQTLKSLLRLREDYDLLFVDNRGTGGSAPQECDFAPATSPQLYFQQMWPDDRVRDCRARLARDANLDLYTTSIAVDDLNDLRGALGYPKLVLYGGSYGTTFYLAYARQHPESVESIVLQGVAPPHFLILPLQFARGAQTAVDGLIAACAADIACKAHFPNFGRRFAAVAARFDRGPVRVPLHDAKTKGTVTIALSKEVFADRLRQLLYYPEGAAYLPFIIERAYHGDYAPLARTIELVAQNFAGYGSGLNLSVTCAEDVPFITESAILATSAHSFEGDVRVRAQQRACALWNVAPVAAAFQEPVRSDAPILMISGTDDPATPPEYARAALAYLPNARILSIRGGTHDTESACIDDNVVAFVHASSAKGLNLDRCSGAYRRPPFATSLAGLGD
ncbi:MAG TPA: alpha/beta hydrolase [Candidatus Acidoferrales bacterium]|jgi:pimeloyl-ACP methyl ester carboxylesterase|nr:alpha/beta hydrolase [Candidatus Acidoferrales bacterium]